MEYTVNGLARLAGVSVRTLHWYDEIGLLRPARVTEAGYRMYGPDEVDALQSILFYRALGVPLKQIGALMADASAGRLAALQSHRAALLCRRAQLDALLATLDKTILTEEGKCAMTDAEKFEGFKQKLVAENEAEYGAEARGKYGDTAVDASNAKLMGLSPEQYGEMQKLSARINAALAAAVRAGEAPDGPEGRRIAGLHKQRRRTLFTDSTRGAGQNNVAGGKRTEGTDIGDQFGNGVHHAVGIVLLHGFAV